MVQSHVFQAVGSFLHFQLSFLLRGGTDFVQNQPSGRFRCSTTCTRTMRLSLFEVMSVGGGVLIGFMCLVYLHELLITQWKINMAYIIMEVWNMIFFLKIGDWPRFHVNWPGWTLVFQNPPVIPSEEGLEPVKASSGGVWGSKHLLTKYLED